MVWPKRFGFLKLNFIYFVVTLLNSVFTVWFHLLISFNQFYCSSLLELYQSTTALRCNFSKLLPKIDLFIFIFFIFLFFASFHEEDLYKKKNKINCNLQKIVCPVGWGCRIHQLYLCRGVRFLQQVSWIWH